MNRYNLSPDILLMKNQMEVLSKAEGFFESSILFALLKLKIFERIGDGSKTVHELAAELAARPETLARLLNAGVALKLLESGDGVNFRVAPACGSVLLPSAGENCLADYILLMDHLQLVFCRLAEAVLNSKPIHESPTCFGADKDQIRRFTLAMHSYATLRAKELADFLDTSQAKTFLDLGCGPGTYAFYVGMRNPALKLYLLDSPEVLDVARGLQHKYAIRNEVQYLPLDALREEIPGSYDLILISNALHMLGEEASRDLIHRLYKSINPGGSLVIQAQYLRDARVGTRWPIFLDLIQLCTTPNGRNHSVDETTGWLAEAGFQNIQYHPMTLLNTNSFIRGYRA